MSNRFHNKFHRHNHHTDSTSREDLYPDSAYDPIASYESPFKGDFYLSGNFIGYKSARIDENLLVSGDYSRLNTNVYITSATDIFVTNILDSTPALRVTQLGGISGAPIARFLGNVGERDTGEYTILFDRFGQVGVGTLSAREILHIQQQSTTNNGVILLETVSNSSILRLESFDNGAIHFANVSDSPLEPYAIIEGNGEGSVVIRSSSQDTITIIDSPSGNSFILEKISNSAGSEGGLAVETNDVLAGRIVIDQSQNIRLQPGDSREDALTIESNKDGHFARNLTAVGDISSGSLVYDPNSNSSLWGSVYTSVYNTSASWDSVYATTKRLSGIWSGDLYDKIIATIQVDEGSRVVLSSATNIQEIGSIATGVTFISAFTNNFRGNTYTLTNKTTASININQTPIISIRQGHSWRASSSNYTDSFLTLPINGSCFVHFDSQNKISVW